MSRPRSQGANNPKGKAAAAGGRGAANRPTPARGAAGNRANPRGQALQQVHSDIYTALLGVSLFACLVSCGLLAWLWNDYGFALKPN